MLNFRLIINLVAEIVYAYRFQYRLADESHILNAFGPLTQQYITDVFSKIEEERFSYLRSEEIQEEFRSETACGIKMMIFLVVL